VVLTLKLIAVQFSASRDLSYESKRKLSSGALAGI
jgi:hypothetical protein